MKTYASVESMQNDAILKVLIGVGQAAQQALDATTTWSHRTGKWGSHRGPQVSVQDDENGAIDYRRQSRAVI